MNNTVINVQQAKNKTTLVYLENGRFQSLALFLQLVVSLENLHFLLQLINLSNKLLCVSLPLL
jgi:hypothetical protein